MGKAAALLVALAIVGASACGGSGDDAAQTTVAPTTSAASTTIATTTTTSTTTTTAVPTPTIDPTVSLIAEIEADLNAGEQVFLAGASNPGSPESRTNLERHFTGKALEVLSGFYDTLVDESLIARPNPDVPSTIRVLELRSDAADATAEILYCRIDAGVVVDLLPDGSEAIIDDSITRYDTETEVFRLDGLWVLQGGGEVVAERLGVQSCD